MRSRALYIHGRTCVYHDLDATLPSLLPVVSSNPGSFPSQVWLSLSSVASAWSILTQAAPAIGGKAIKTPLGGILRPLPSLQPQALHGLIQHMVAIRTITT